MAGFFGTVLFLFVIGLSVHGLMSLINPNPNNNIILSSERWECTKTTYPSAEKKEMFRPYCSQYTAKKEEVNK